MNTPFVNIHTHKPTGRCIELRTAGIHPWDAARAVRSADGRVELPPLPAGVQAVGEIGLDFACEVPAETQTAVFRAQLQQACEAGLPVVLHCVRAFEAVMRELEQRMPRAVIFHGFIGSPEQARQALAAGCCLAFGERTFGSPRTLRALGEVPADRLFVETDESDLPIETLYREIASARGQTVETLRREVLANYVRIFGAPSESAPSESDAAESAPGGAEESPAEWTQRTEWLLGRERLDRLAGAHVLVVGLGGVGAYAAEMIARAGVGRMTIADGDAVSCTNINRQLVALHSTVGRRKTEVLAARLRDINPRLRLTTVDAFIRDEETYALLDAARYDYVVDAIDTLSPKLALIAGALERGIPLVSSMGAGAKLDPTRMEIADISKTHHCPLAHMLRKRLHRIGIRSGFQAVFSAEQRAGELVETDERNKKSNVGTISYLPALFGIGCASVVIRALAGGEE